MPVGRPRFRRLRRGCRVDVWKAPTTGSTRPPPPTDRPVPGRMGRSPATARDRARGPAAGTVLPAAPSWSLWRAGGLSAVAVGSAGSTRVGLPECGLTPPATQVEDDLLRHRQGVSDADRVEFDAEGVTLRGWLYVPDGATGPVPTIVMAHGFSAVKEMYLDRFAEAFAAAGLAALVFDNRNFGASDDEPRQETPGSRCATIATRSPTPSPDPRLTTSASGSGAPVTPADTCWWWALSTAA